MSQHHATGPCDCPLVRLIPTLACAQPSAAAPALPQPEQQVRVTLLKDFHQWQGNLQRVIPAGVVYVGSVAAVDGDGFFDLITESGEVVQLYAYDPILRVELVAPVETP